MLPDNVALPDTLRSPVIATNPALIVCTVAPAMLARIFPPDATTATLEVPLAICVVSTLDAAIVAGVVPSGWKNAIVLPVAVFIITLPRYKLLPDRYKSFQRLVADPRSYVTLATGLKLPVI